MRELLNFGLIFREYTGGDLIPYEGGTLIVHRFDNPTAIMILGYLMLIAVGYLLGSLNSGIIISRLIYKNDIRNHGSGTDLADIRRIYGNAAAVAAFVFDGVKTVAAIFIGMMVFGNHSDLVVRYAGPYIGGFAAAVGNAFPFYNKFKGGKAVAAICFMAFMTEPFAAVICLVVFIIVTLGTKYISLGFLISVMAYPMILHRLTGMGLHNVIAIAFMLTVVLLHRENIKSISAGTEKKLDLSWKKKKKANSKTNISEDD